MINLSCEAVRSGSHNSPIYNTSSCLSNEPLAQNVNSQLLSKVTNRWHKTSVVKSSKSFGRSHI